MPEPADPSNRIGLCARCTRMRLVTTRRGSTFYLCSRHLEDPRFRKYPPLPVLECRGFEPAPPEQRGSESSAPAPDQPE